MAEQKEKEERKIQKNQKVKLEPDVLCISLMDRSK